MLCSFLFWENISSKMATKHRKIVTKREYFNFTAETLFQRIYNVSFSIIPRQLECCNAVSAPLLLNWPKENFASSKHQFMDWKTMKKNVNFELFTMIYRRMQNLLTNQRIYTCDKQVLWESAGAFFFRATTL